MKLDTAINHKMRASARIKHIWSTSKTFSLTHKEIMERTNKVFETIAHCPEWVKSYVRGQNDLLLEQVYQHLEFCYMNEHGDLFSTWRETSHLSTEVYYTSGRGIELCRMKGHHYWKGTRKVF